MRSTCGARNFGGLWWNVELWLNQHVPSTWNHNVPGTSIHNVPDTWTLVERGATTFSARVHHVDSARVYHVDSARVYHVDSARACHVDLGRDKHVDLRRFQHDDQFTLILLTLISPYCIHGTFYNYWLFVPKCSSRVSQTKQYMWAVKRLFFIFSSIRWRFYYCLILAYRYSMIQCTVYT